MTPPSRAEAIRRSVRGLRSRTTQRSTTNIGSKTDTRSETDPRATGRHRSLKVLQLTTNAEATYVRNQVDALANLGVESDVLEAPDRSGSGSRGPTDYVRFCPRVRNRITGEYDLVHANFGLTIPAGLAQRRIPVVTSLVGTDLMGRYGFVTKTFARLCAEIIVVSPEMNELLSRDATVIPYGIDVDLFRPIETKVARTTVGWEPDAHCVLFPYHPNRHVKNYPKAERVVREASARLGEEIELKVITGNDYSEMPYYMNAADLLLLTSRREGSPVTVKEALACNTPVVSTPVGDVPERVSDLRLSGTGNSVDELAELVCRVLEDDDGEHGRDAVWDLRLERMGERILEVYERALE